MTSSQAVSSFVPHQTRRPGRPKVARPPETAAERRQAGIIAVRKMAMCPIKTALVKMGMSQRLLVTALSADASIDISEQTLSNYLNGHAGIARETLDAICGICGISAEEILGSLPNQSLLLQAVNRPLRYQRHNTNAKAKAKGVKPAKAAIEENQEPPC